MKSNSNSLEHEKYCFQKAVNRIYMSLYWLISYTVVVLFNYAGKGERVQHRLRIRLDQKPILYVKFIRPNYKLQLVTLRECKQVEMRDCFNEINSFHNNFGSNVTVSLAAIAWESALI